MEELCLLCKEPITNPLTIEDIAKHVEIWLPEELSKDFLEFHSSLLSHLHPEESPLIPGKAVCIYCYVKEVYDWLTVEDDQIGERFLDTFSFGFSKESLRKHVKMHLIKDTEEERKEFGICDECGEYTDDLVEAGGEWVCMTCETYK